MIPANPKPEQFVALIDTREQHPLDLSPLRTEPATLATGDYALKGCNQVVIERKSLSDLLKCVGTDRSRFEKEIQRMRAFPTRVLLVEACWGEIELAQWARSRLTSSQVMGALVGWSAHGIQVEMIGSHKRAGEFASRLLYTVGRRRWREARELIEQSKVETKTGTMQEIESQANGTTSAALP